MKKCPVCNSAKFTDLHDFETQKIIGKVCRKCGYKSVPGDNSHANFI
jgi:uncharacterized OB-fold protein